MTDEVLLPFMQVVGVPPLDSPLLEPHNYHWDDNGISLMYRNGVTILLRTFNGVWFSVMITVSMKVEKMQRTARASDDDGWLTRRQA